MAETPKNPEASKQWVRRVCPLCQSSQLSDKPEVQAKHAAELMPWEEVRDSFIGLRHDQVFFSYYRCPQCHLLYCPWYFSADQLTTLYSQMPDNLIGEDKSTASKTQSGYVRWIRSRVGNVSSFLELGPDIGLVTQEVVAQTKLERMTLVEPNLAVQKELRFNAEGGGKIEIVQYLEEVENDKFELVIGIHVFDHLLDPLKDLSSLAEKSAQGSHLGLVVHNEASLLRKVIRKKWPPFCLQHPQLYNPKSLQAMLDAGGWKLEKVAKSTNYFHLNHLAEMAFGVLGLPKSLSKLVPRVETPINLGNMIALNRKSD
jgi:hypothetical protein